MAPIRRKYARVFADLLNEVQGEEGGGDAFFMAGKSVSLAQRRSQQGKKEALKNAQESKSAEKSAPSALYYDARPCDIGRMAPQMRDDVKSTLRKAKATAKEQSKDQKEWVKFWEPLQRCCYYVSSKSGESRWAAHFDEAVMVVEAEDGAVTYVHSATGKTVDGPAEAPAQTLGDAVWSTLVDPVSGQVYYFSRLSEESRWDCPHFIDYYCPENRALYYVDTWSNDSTWERPSDFFVEARAGAEASNADHMARTLRGVDFSKTQRGLEEAPKMTLRRSAPPAESPLKRGEEKENSESKAEPRRTESKEQKAESKADPASPPPRKWRDSDRHGNNVAFDVEEVIRSPSYGV
ncbi:hypothetical protein M885DRAFT_48161 [Pelagophyceae sp. CCMP2097]|nr:hypothetical protein M885DRAFT_48161 [Pelagophyceae sp. CCMP2097]